MTEKETERLAAEIDATRERLVAHLDEIVDRSQPERMVNNQVEKVRSFYIDEHGGIRADRAMKTAGIVLGLALLRKLFK